MPAKPPELSTSQSQRLVKFGERLQLARLRRNRSMAEVCSEAGISRMTLFRAESGSAAVTLGTYVLILAVFRLDKHLDLLAKDDIVGHMMQDLELPLRRLRDDDVLPPGWQDDDLPFS